MLPSFAPNYISNHRVINVITLAQRSGRVPLRGKRADLQNLRLGELRGRPLFASLPTFRMYAGTMPTFVPAVSHVISTRTKKQVIRANASANVAMVAYVKARRDRAISQFIGKAVSVGETGVNCHRPITIGLYASGPHPAGISFIDPAPKGINACYDIHVITPYPSSGRAGDVFSIARTSHA